MRSATGAADRACGRTVPARGGRAFLSSHVRGGRTFRLRQLTAVGRLIGLDTAHRSALRSRARLPPRLMLWPASDSRTLDSDGLCAWRGPENGMARSGSMTRRRTTHRPRRVRCWKLMGPRERDERPGTATQRCPA